MTAQSTMARTRNTLLIAAGLLAFATFSDPGGAQPRPSWSAPAFLGAGVSTERPTGDQPTLDERSAPSRMFFLGSPEGIAREIDFKTRGYEEGRRLGTLGGDISEYLGAPMTTDREAAFMLGLVEGYDETKADSRAFPAAASAPPPGSTVADR